MADLLADPRKQRLLDWLTTIPSEREPATKKELATELGVVDRTLRSWQNEPAFRREWEKRAFEVAGDPDRTQRVLDALYEAATDRGARDRVSAAKHFLEATGAIKPPPMQVEVSSRVQELSDQELDELIALEAARVRKEREAREMSP